MVFDRSLKERAKEEMRIKDRSPRERSHRVRLYDLSKWQKYNFIVLFVGFSVLQ